MEALNGEVDDITNIDPDVHFFTSNNICEFHTVEQYFKLLSESNKIKLELLNFYIRSFPTRP